MQRSHRLKSSGPLNGPVPKLPPGPRLHARLAPSGTIAGILPSAGSMTNHARLPLVTS